METQHALVTGGAGFIGSHLAHALRQRGHGVTVLDDLSAGAGNVLLLKQWGVQLVRGDIRRAADVRRAFKGATVVFHLAAMNRALRSIRDPWGANDVNVNGTLRLLEAARRASLSRFVFASSSSVYGVRDAEKTRFEDSPVFPAHPYGVGKLAGEHYARVYHELYGVPTVSLRYASVYGPRQRGNLDYAAVIPKFTDALLAGKPLTVYGTGKQTRPFTFVADTVEATLRAWKAPAAVGEVFNVANPAQVRVLDIVRALEKLTGKRARVAFKPPIPGDPRRNPVSIAKARRLLKWAPRYSFEHGMRETLAARTA